MNETIDATGAHPFFHLVNQVGLTADNPNLYFIALMSALSLPDICGALESDDGRASGARYKAWFDQWVAYKYQVRGEPSLTGHDCYMLRCAALHQGRLSHDNAVIKRIIFIEPGAGQYTFHNNMMNGCLNIDVQVFCSDMIGSVCDWFESVVGTNPFEKNHAQSMQRYPLGFGPIHGAPVIA